MGKQSGKLGQSVLSTRYGEQIQRAYVKEIANPKTEAQVATRVRFKLASQLSAAMADVIAIPRVGSKTGRNQFVSATMDITSEAAGVAQVDLNSVQLTKSQRGLVGFSATRDSANNKISIALNDANGAELSRVVYVVFEKQNDGSLVQIDSKVISEAGADNTFPADLRFSDKSVVLYAYGISDKDGATSVKFGNLTAPTAEQVAKLITTSSDVLAGVNLTKTNGATMNVGTDNCNSDNAIPVAASFRSVTIKNSDWNANKSNQVAGNTQLGGFVANAGENWHAALVTPGVNPPVLGEEYSIKGQSDMGVNAETGAFSTVAVLQEAETYYLVAGPQENAEKITAELIYPYYYGTEDNQP